MTPYQGLIYPELEMSIDRQKIIISMLETDPSLIPEIKAFIEDFENGDA